MIGIDNCSASGFMKYFWFYKKFLNMIGIESSIYRIKYMGNKLSYYYIFILGATKKMCTSKITFCKIYKVDFRKYFPLFSIV